MKILIVSNIFLNEKTDEKELFMHQLLKKIISNNSKDEFFFISTIEKKDEFKDMPNVAGIVTSPVLKNSLLRKYWYNVKLPSIIKKQKADIFISLIGISPSAINIPQLICVNGCSAVDKLSTGALRNSSIFVFSQLTANKLQKEYSILKDRIQVLTVFYPETKLALDIYDRELVKQEYTSGKNYFIFNGIADNKENLIILLRAFSIFKKRQKSDWKFVFIGRFKNRRDKFMSDFNSYKYRDDVVLIEKSDNSNQQMLLAGSYAWVNPTKEENFGIAVLEPLIYDVPVIVAKDTAYQELAGDAALCFDFGDQQSLADQMMFLYKDEQQRTALIGKAKDRINGLTIENSATGLWRLIQSLKASD